MNSPKPVTIPDPLRRFWPYLFLALVPLIPLFRAVFMGEAIGPFEQIRQMAPWNGPKPSQPWDVLQADGVLQFYVWRDLVFEAWGNGQIPFWNSYQLAGAPLLANSQSGALYPPHIAMGVLHVSTATAMTLLAWFHLFWAGLGAYFLSRRLGAGRIGGCIAGASFSLSSFMIAWTSLPSVIETVAWIPWVLAYLLVSMRAGGKTKVGPLLLVSLCTAMMVLAGHLQFVAYGFIAATGLALWWGLSRRIYIVDGIERATSLDVFDHPISDNGGVWQWRPAYFGVVACFLALGAGVLLAAPQLLPVLKYSQFSHRRNVPTDDGYQAYIGSSIQPYELAKVFIPTIQGNPREMASENLPVSTYYPALLKPGANFAESALGIGIVVAGLLCLLFVLLRPWEPSIGFLAVGALGLLLALGTPLNRLFYYGVPGWSSTGSPGRAECLFVLVACVSAGVAASRLSHIAAKPLKVGGAIFAVLLVCSMLMQSQYAVPDKVGPAVIDALKGQAISSSLPGAVGILFLFGLAFWLFIKENSIRARVLILCLPIVCCVASIGMSLIQTGRPELKVTETLGMQRIAPINNAWDLYTAQHATLPPNLAALNRIHSLDGYDSLLHRDTVGLLRDIDGKDPAPPANGNIMYVKPTADLKKLADAGVTEIWSAKPIAGAGTPKEEDGLLKYRLAGPGRASTPEGPAEITGETRSSLRIHAFGPGKLVVRERNMPGWLAKVDGRHASISGKMWMELELGPGEHTIELNYVAPGFMLGLFLAIPMSIVVIVIALWRRMSVRHPVKSS